MKRRDYFGINFSFWSIAWDEALQPSSNEKGQPIRQQPQKSRRYTTWYEVRTMSLCFMNQKDGASAWLFSLPLSNTSVIAKKHRGETIVTEIEVEGTVPRSGNIDPVPETRGYSYLRLIKTALFLSPPYKNLSQGPYPVSWPHRPRNFMTMAYGRNFAY